MLLVDESDRVLLLSGIDRTKPDVAAWWFPIGGALEPGESAQGAAIRETFEETGLTIEDPGRVVFTREFSWDFEGSTYDQTESYFFVRTERFELSPSNWTQTESATIRAHRWWSVRELRATSEVVFPEDLPSRLESLLRSAQVPLQNGPRRVSLWARAVEASVGRATVQGEVWLGPIVVGDCFTAATRADDKDAVCLTLAEMTEPADAQEAGRVARVTAVVIGEGVHLLRAGDVLTGEVDRA